MKTFLEVENKMGPIIPALASRFRLPLPETNPNVRKSDASEKRKRVMHKRKDLDQQPPELLQHAHPYQQVPPKIY